MDLFPFFNKKIPHKIKIVLFLDGGKGNARGAVIETRKGIPHILYSVSGEQKIGLPESKETFSLALSSLEEVLRDIAHALQAASAKNIRYVAEEVYCILAEPYYLSHTSLITHTPKDSFVVSSSLIKNLIASHHEALPEAHKEVLLGATPQVIRERLIEIKINGYHSESPYGKTAKELQLALFRTQIDKVVIEAVTRIIKKVTPARLSIEALSLAAFIAVRNRVDTSKDFILVTVGNDVSEISLVKDHIPLETVSFPFGKHSLARLIAKKINAAPEEALCRLALYHDKKLSQEEEKNFYPILEETQILWFSYLEKTLVSLSEEITLPEDVYILVDSSFKDMFEASLTNKSFASQTLVPRGFSIHTLDAIAFADHCTFGLDIRFDAMLAIAASFAKAQKEIIDENAGKEGQTSPVKESARPQVSMV